MAEDKKDAPAEEPKKDAAAQAPADALSRTPEDLAQEAATSGAKSTEPAEEKVSPLRRLFRKVNVYFLIFLLIVVVAGAITVVNYLNSQKAAPTPDITSQALTEDALKQLQNTDASVGSSSQTLTIQGSAVINGQTLARGNLNVAGNIQTGGSIQGPNLTISGSANLGQTQVNSLQVASGVTIQGQTTLGDLNVSGATSLSGPLTASQITVTRLILSGNASLQVPNHIAFTGASPGRSINNAVLGNGGSASINGSDTSGSININTGSGTVAGCFATITFNQPFTTQPHVIVSPVGQAAGQTQFYVTRTFTSFNICTANAAPENATFGYDYFITS